MLSACDMLPTDVNTPLLALPGNAPAATVEGQMGRGRILGKISLTVTAQSARIKKLLLFISCALLFAFIGSAHFPTHARSNDPNTLSQKNIHYDGASSAQACPLTYVQIANHGEFDQYYGATSMFHGGYRGFVGKQKASDNLYPECFYDDEGAFIDAHHPDATCAGSADEYKASGLNMDTLKHWFYDRGGPIDMKQFAVTQYALDGYVCASKSRRVKLIDPSAPTIQLALNARP